MQFKNNVNFNKKQLKNAVIEKLGTAPSNAVEGQVYFNDGSVTEANKGLYIYQGTTWKKLSDQNMSANDILTALSGVDGSGSGLDADKLDGYDASAFYLASTTLNNIAVPTGNVAMNGHSITGLKTEDANNNTTNAATTQYVDRAVSNAIQGLDVKSSVRAASTPTSGNVAYTRDGNVCTITTPFSTLDGVNVATIGTRILLKNQTDANQNAIYSVSGVSGGSVTELTIVINDMQTTGGSINQNAFVFVEQGTTNADTGWVLSSSILDVPLFVGGQPNVLTWHQFASAGQITAGTGITRSGNTISIDTAVVARKASFLLPATAANTPIVVTHSFISRPLVAIIEESTKEYVFTKIEYDNPTEIKITFDDAIVADQYRVVVIG